MKRTIAKAGRLPLLHRLRDAGVIESQTLRAVGDALGVDRSTILRDFRELDQVEAERHRLMVEQPWVKSELNIAEFAEESVASPKTVRVMIRDELVKAHQRTGKWRGGERNIPADEIERFRK